MDYARHVAGAATTSACCVVSFSSRPHVFEWGRFLTRIGVPHVLMRDSTERWYQEGVTGLGGRVDVLDCICDLKAGYDKVIALGLSSGSYAALLYGDACAVDMVLMVSPVTGKGDALMSDFDPRWHYRIEHGPEHPPVADLKPMMPRGPRVPVRAYVSDGEGTELDRQMALRVGINEHSIIHVPGYSHSTLGAAVRDNGMLENMIKQVVA